MIELDNAVVYHGSNLDVLPTLPDNSVDAIVTDPPYELGFMGKSWDSSGIAYSVELWQECLRVLKPGGHLLAFGGSRTWHRIAVAIEDAGFDVRDSIAWLYGSGFPKSLDIAKAIQKASGVEALEAIENENGRFYGEGYNPTPRRLIMPELEGEAKKWQGWGTALKPAFEPIVVSRKPLVGTVAANVLEWGVGGLNIDGSRIGYQDDNDGGDWERFSGHQSSKTIRANLDGNDGATLPGRVDNGKQSGRWPANIILDEYTAGLLDEQAPATGSWSKAGNNPVSQKPQDSHLAFAANYQSENYGDGLQGASRFFYVAKASKKDRNEGLDSLTERQTSGGGGGVGDYLDDVNSASGKFGSEKAPAKNFHPTVKPTALMEYLVKLVTPPNGTVLDPFTGSGSTGKAALLNGFKFIGIELTADYLPIIEGRLKHAAETYANKATEEETKEQETLF